MTKKMWWSLALLWPMQVFAAERALVPAKSEVGFAIKQMGVTVSGRFLRYSAKIVLDPAQIDKASAQFAVDTASIATGDDATDQEAKARAWLDAAGFPQARFVSDGVRSLGKDRYEASGSLTLKGKTRPLKVPFALANQPDGSSLASGEFKLQRADFGIGGGEWNEGDLVSPEVTVRFKLALAPAAP